MTRRFNYRRVKIHRNYEIAELAALIGAHRQTICRWIAAGLPTTEPRRPHLVRGIDFRAFMRAHEPIKQHCQPGEFYCLGCRAPRRPAGEMAHYVPRTATRGALSGICPTCDKMIYRAMSIASIGQIGGGLDITFSKAERRLSDSSEALSNVALKQDQQT
jgi:hypothetical protein